MAITSSSSSSSSSASLAPGFRFHPTDEELVRYYLRRKICGKPFKFDAISDIDIYKLEPWDLPGKSRLKSRDLEWYFFSILDKKYGNSSRTNRATERGYWKTTGKDRAVYHKSQVVGMKKTLVYHSGRAPRGERTNWVMHEYRLVDEELEKAGILQDAFVLCRVFQKSGSGPKNGEQYGAPFVEEEWENDELEMVPKMEHAEEVEVGADAYLDGHDLEQILGTDIPPVEAPFPLDFYCGDNGTFVEDSTDSTNDGQNLLVGVGENHYVHEEPDIQNMHEMPIQYDMETRPVKHEYLRESSNNFEEVDYLLDEPYLDASENVQFGEGAYLETNDLLNPIAADTLGFDDMLEEYLTFHDANVAFDLPKMMESEDLPSGQAVLVEKDVNEGTQQAMTASEQLTGPNKDAASSSKQEPVKFASECQYPFLEQASRMLGSIPAPPAFASEFPKKDAALHLNSISQSSSSVHVTAGVIQIRNLPLGGVGTDWSLGKHGGYNIILSFGLLQSEDDSANLESTVSLLPGKSVAAMSRGWFYFLFLWVLVLSMSFKIGTMICAR